MNEAPEIQAVKLMDDFVATITRLAPKLGRSLVITEKDGDQVSFELGDYPFTLSWEVVETPSIGRTVPVVKFALCIWHLAPGGYWHPPESVDTTLVEKTSIFECIRVAFETIAKDEVRIILENDGYEQQAKEEVNAEW